MKYFRQISLTVVIAAFALACETVSISPDPQLYGKWGSVGERFEFRDGGSFSQLILRRTSIPKDTANADSIFGTYEVDSKRNNINFTMTGYRKADTKKIVMKSYNMAAWNYSVTADTLKYESLGQINRLVKNQ